MSKPDWSASRALLADWPVVIDTQVAWGEMDAFAHVNNVVYFRYFESARIAYFDAVGYNDLTQNTGLGSILAETRCRFRAPLTYPDRISVGARVSRTAGDRFDMQFAVASCALERIAAEGDGVAVSYDYNKLARIPLPAEILSRIQALEQRS